MVDPADQQAEARRRLGLARLEQVPRRPHADPSRGGARGYPEWFRNEQVALAAAGLPTRVSPASISRWRNNGTARMRMTGNADSESLVGVDQYWLCYYKFLYPEASFDECATFLYDRTGNVYENSAISKRLKEMGYSRKRGSTEAYQAFLPRNVLRHRLFWTAPPPLGIAGVQREQLFDCDEAGFELSNVNRTHGHAPQGIRVRKPGNYSKGMKCTLVLMIEPGNPNIPNNLPGSIALPRRYYKIFDKAGITAHEYAAFMTEALDAIANNPLPLPVQPDRKVMHDNLRAHRAPVTLQAIDGHPSGRFEAVCRAPYRPYEGPIEYIFCQLADALNRRAHQIRDYADLQQAITNIIPNLTGFNNTFIHCGY